MDADDISDPRRLEIEKEYLYEHGECDFVGTRSQFFIKQIGDDEKITGFAKNRSEKTFFFHFLLHIHHVCFGQRHYRK